MIRMRSAATLMMGAALLFGAALSAQDAPQAAAALGGSGATAAPPVAALGAQQTGPASNEAGAAAVKQAAPSPNPPAPVPARLEPEASGPPHTEMLDNARSEHDPLLEPKPLPPAGLSLLGGFVVGVDGVRNRIIVQPFGGGNTYAVYFDERTRILSDGRETTVLAIHRGDRVHVDTQQLDSRVFAKTIQVGATASSVQASGQVVSVDGGTVQMQDRMSGQFVTFIVSGQTSILSHGKAMTMGSLPPGALIEVIFVPGRQGEAKNILVQAIPGESFIFAGRLTHVDLRDGILALDNQTDGNNYELYFDPLAQSTPARLEIGIPVQVTASFDGRRYHATSITVMPLERSEQ